MKQATIQKTSAVIDVHASSGGQQSSLSPSFCENLLHGTCLFSKHFALKNERSFHIGCHEL